MCRKDAIQVTKKVVSKDFGDIVFSLLLMIACSGETTENSSASNKNVILTTDKHAAAKPNDFTEKSFKCCDTPEASELLNKYLALTTAMAADDDAKTKAAVTELQQFTQSDAFNTLAAKDDLKELKEAAQYWTTLERKEIQKDFSEASQNVIDFAKVHKSDSGQSLITAYCPMAPGRWLQTESTISNPYYGSMMLTCGVFE